MLAPVRVYWETFKFLLSVKQRCRNVKAIYFIWSGQNTLSDFLIFLWPVKDIAAVRISRRQRITLASMFSCGLVVCVAGSARIYYTRLYLYSYDVLWWGATVFAVMSVETCIGIVCGCLPGCKPLMSRLLPQVFGISSNRDNNRPRDQGRVKEITASEGSRTVDSTKASFQLQSLNSGGRGLVILPNQSGYAMNSQEKRDMGVVNPKRPAPAMFKADKSIAWRNSRDNNFGGEDEDFNESQEFIVLQRQSTISIRSM
ncbi:uncharacterized protein N0V89_003286 [Didymosphaeria variabile]|uniref:Rhodopsin domain-containing protein n=1 Tax=Didymosphaeria variabile TaxID=1932322 RepID=A0A9W9CF73_9PLEO|nr:uncharacterized protein N0V89_003286 [Didymosphaeria variabile]KAJ4358702.1 hypothetical protein N0V89_003286 [Didymosphaeria variabile]